MVNKQELHILQGDSMEWAENNHKVNPIPRLSDEQSLFPQNGISQSVPRLTDVESLLGY